MRPLCIILALLCEICQVPADIKKTSGITQDSGVIKAKEGTNVTLRCVCRDDAVTFFYWYQQSLGGKLEVISIRMKEKAEAEISPGYKERFGVSAQSQDSSNHLTITDLRPLDSAAYFCGTLEFNAIEFGQGAFLYVKSSLSNTLAYVHQPAAESLGPGESLNLSCAVYTELPHVGTQSFFWIRASTGHGASEPVDVYPSAAQCTRFFNGKSHMMNCTLNLAKKSVSSSDAGMYRCVLASYGEIVFGNGTTVQIGSSTEVPPLLVYCLSVALAVSINVLVVLAFTMYKLRKKLCPTCTGILSHLTCLAATSKDADTLNYAALSLKRNSQQHHQEDNMETVCVYSRVKNGAS
ncbi:uncharacterized protein LOC118300075 isoform X1 [Scophthalmus maximus]|uniref:Ig-like domain-containing protein n=1 Tax=Scophthalmus maximus TaxID=52904 RepID=A0A8D3AX23_SCOMX|nr:uncharacterized protein LOC118300075 isoform X1 [Scophthalmus maximus]